jgi:hypothetical protein
MGDRDVAHNATIDAYVNRVAELESVIRAALNYAGFYKDGQPHIPAWVPRARAALAGAGLPGQTLFIVRSRWYAGGPAPGDTRLVGPL